MKVSIISRDANGTPTKINIDDGCSSYTKDYVPEEDGWILEQLNPRDFPAIRTGHGMEFLVQEVNRLRRELFRANQILNKL